MAPAYECRWLAMRWLIAHTLVGLTLGVAVPAAALDASKGPTGANHARAQRYATGGDVRVGILDTVFFGIPAPHHLGSRLLEQVDFYNKTPSQSPDPLTNLVDDHERLAAHIIASDDLQNTGVAPQALIINAAINDLNLDSRRAASAWLHAERNVSIFSLSAGFGTNTNGTGTEALYWDWLMRSKNTLLVVAAGNSGNQINIPADTYNGIAVGAYDQATQARASFSAFALNDVAVGTEGRGKPDILAPGVWVGDGIGYSGFYSQGTSFASPHVAGAAALLTSYAATLNPQPSTLDPLDHRGLKALLMNSARKRQIAVPEATSPVSADGLLAGHPTYDRDYLDCSQPACVIAGPAATGVTTTWTPSGWSFDGAKLSVTKPLDDEQGVGYLDATRAITNLAGGNHTAGLVPGIGWDADAILPIDSPDAFVYALDQTLAAGSFLTATLAWDRVAVESDGDGTVDDDDAYAFGELANLDLRLLNAADQVVAESISTTDNIEHLHVPLPANGMPGDFKLQVIYNGGGLLATDFALAWWTDPTPLVPGDYNLDGLVDALDYNVWRANFATSSDTRPLLHGDGNHDGTVDAADYTTWRAHIGQVWSPGGGAGAIAAVPECSTLLLAVVAQLSLLGVCRRRSGFSLTSTDADCPPCENQKCR
jgi:hypothetical protein